MSIEQLIEEHTAALKENTAAVQGLITAMSGAEPAAKSAKAAPAKSAKAAPAKSAKAAPAKSTKADDDYPTDDDFKKVLGEFLKAAADEDGRNARKVAVQKLFKQFGVTKASDVSGKPEGQELMDAINELAEDFDQNEGDDDLV